MARSLKTWLSIALGPPWRTQAIRLMALGLACSAAFLLLRPSPPARTVRVGIDHAPPYQVIGENGEIGGLTVEMVQEAARRHNIPIVWVHWEKSIDQAFNEGLVDLWPAGSITPERQQRLHITEPWLYNSYYIVSAKGRDKATAATLGPIGHTRQVKHASMVKDLFPNAATVVKSARTAVLQSVCTHEVIYGFLESRYLDSALLERPVGCESTDLEINLVPNLTRGLGMLATREFGSIADVLRSEINTLAADGSMARSLDRWSPLSTTETKALFALKDAEQRAAFLRWSTGLGVVFIAILLWLIRRARRAQRLSEQAHALATAAGERLFEERQRLRRMVEDLPAGAAFISGDQITVNRRVEEITGYDRSELATADAWFQRLYGDKADVIRVDWARYNNTAIYAYADGHARSASLATTLNPDKYQYGNRFYPTFASYNPAVCTN